MSKLKTRPFDMVNYLQDEADVAEYLRQVLEDGDPASMRFCTAASSSSHWSRWLWGWWVMRSFSGAM